MLEYLRHNIGVVRLAIYLITIVFFFFKPIVTGFIFLKLLAILLLLLLLLYLYRKTEFYNVNYRIPDILCIFCLLNQIGYIIWTFINR